MRTVTTYMVYNKTQAVLESAVDHPETHENALKYARNALEYAQKRYDDDLLWWWVLEDIEQLITRFEACINGDIDCHRLEEGEQDEDSI
ncbi:hypothetical protein VPHD479_0251 [Vibrio phage D479]